MMVPKSPTSAEPYAFRKAQIPLLLSLPHEGSHIPPRIAAQMLEAGQSSWDTDWFLDRLYNTEELHQAGRIAGKYSRYVIDLNRSLGDQSLYPGQGTTGLLPFVTFSEEPIYEPGMAPDEEERSRRIREIWQPYHDQLRLELERIRGTFGFAVLLEGHSIASQVPFLFEGVLPDLNFGTDRGKSCAASLSEAVLAAVESHEEYSHIVDGRFIGGYITREYGDPASGIHAIQLELSQATHLDEKSKQWAPKKVEKIRPVLKTMLKAILQWIDGQ